MSCECCDIIIQLCVNLFFLLLVNLNILLWWVVDLEQVGGLHGDIRWFTFHYWECWLSCEYCDIIVQLCVNLFYLLLVNSNILLWWVVDLEQAGCLHGDIRQCILFWECWLCCSYCAIIIDDELSHSRWNVLNNSIFYVII